MVEDSGVSRDVIFLHLLEYTLVQRKKSRDIRAREYKRRSKN